MTTSDRSGGTGAGTSGGIGTASDVVEPGSVAGGEDGDHDPLLPAEESVFGVVLLALLGVYGLVGLSVMVLSAYSLTQGWTLYAGRPYWVALCWPMGMVGLLTPPIMKLDDVTEVKRTPPVLGRALAGYGATVVGFVAGVLLSSHPFGLAGAAATIAFTGLSLQYVRQR